ncbi:MAG TPA: hypothetical protein VFA82_03170 [Gaiellaceae bacterium]|nr:hypothetical protein [Gaiellaceae bacterium]
MDGVRQREAIVAALRDSPAGLDTAEVSALLGVHPNTARWHLGRLIDERLVDAHPEPRPAGSRGRPRIVYRLTGVGATRARDDYRLLATMLTAALADGPDGEARAYGTGRLWGRHLHEDEPGTEIAELLDRQGFAAERLDDRIEMRRCPFYALAEASPQIVCALHRGVIDGALAAAGSGEQVAALRPFAQPSLCVAHLVHAA